VTVDYCDVTSPYLYTLKGTRRRDGHRSSDGLGWVGLVHVFTFLWVEYGCLCQRSTQVKRDQQM